jgi:bifunctional UDP-N-acetylglucosamine pyrophosphorylase/glucosamine-1-phosphate N-acetyltransferase
MSFFRLAAVVLAAGKGTRMRSDLPKVLHRIAGKPMLAHVLDGLAELGPDRTVVVTGPNMPAVAAAAQPHPVALQAEQLGTGHAVAAARAALGPVTADTVLVVYGDTPLLTAQTLRGLVAARRAYDAAVVVLGMRPAEPGAYGRLIVEPDGTLAAIVEAIDATPEQLQIGLCNSGVMAIAGTYLWSLIDQITPNPLKGEYYLTDIVALARAQGLNVRAVEADADELAGVNSRVDLAAAEAVFQQRLRIRAMEEGVTLSDPASTYLSADTRFGRDVVIGQNVVIGPTVSIADRVEIKPFCHIEGTTIASDAIIGPFARLRPGSVLAEGVHVGNFVELKNTSMAAGAKANHLTYLGDATVGPRSNIGAGTITCNYDGFAKHRTSIGADVFVGSDTAFVAPVTIGDGAITAAGSVITEDLPANALGLGRARQVTKPEQATRFRENRRTTTGRKV